ncbi:MAG: hypothetical protein ABIJ16_13525 [Bacteroidota bacterium]
MNKQTLIIALAFTAAFAIVATAYAAINHNASCNFSGSLILDDSRDTTIILKDNSLTAKYRDESDNTDKELMIEMKNNKVSKVFMNGVKLSDKEAEAYRKEIDFTLDAARQAKEELYKASCDLEKADIEEIHEELAEAMKELREVDWPEVSREIQMTLEMLDSEEFNNDIAASVNEIREIKWENLAKELENLDMQIESSLRVLEDEEVMKSIQMSIDCMNSILPDIDEMIEPIIMIDDDNEEPARKGNEEEMENILRSLESE